MKIMYDFEIPQWLEVEEPEVATNEKGEEVKTTKKVKKNIPVKFFLMRPGNLLRNDGDDFYAAEISRLIHKGVMTRDMLRKYILNIGGVLTDAEKKEATKLYDELYRVNSEVMKLKSNVKRTEEENTALDKSNKEWEQVVSNVRKFETTQARLFNHTAELIAQERVIIWWMLMISYCEKDKKQVPFFAGETIQDKYESLEGVQDGEDDIKKQAKDQFLLYTTMFVQANAEKREDFVAIEKDLAKELNTAMETE